MSVTQRFIILPLAMGAITGSLCGGIAWRYLPALDPLGIGLIATLIVWSIVAGLAVLQNWWLPMLETRLNLDIDRDGVIGKPATVSAEPDTVVMLRAAQNEAPLSLAHWKKMGWSRTRWEQARNQLMEEKMIKPKKAGSPSAGYVLTKKGRGRGRIKVFQGGKGKYIEADPPTGTGQRG